MTDMTTVFNVSLMGRNRPGLLRELAEKTHHHKGKWLNSKVNHLDSLVSALIKIELPEGKLDSLKESFRADTELSITFVKSDEPPVPGKVIELVVDADDRPGLVNDLTQQLDAECAEIVDMDCHRVGVAELGRSLFTAKLVLKIPNDRDGLELAAELETMSADMVVTVA